MQIIQIRHLMRMLHFGSVRSSISIRTELIIFAIPTRILLLPHLIRRRTALLAALARDSLGYFVPQPILGIKDREHLTPPHRAEMSTADR